jgi:hypothetical protein
MTSQVFRERRSSIITNPFACQRKCDLQRSRKKEKTLCAPHEPQKVLVVELVSALPDVPGAYVGHRVDGLTGPFKAGDLLPFRLLTILQPTGRGFQPSCSDNLKNISRLLLIFLPSIYDAMLLRPPRRSAL